jgi:hypothetical protein
MKFRSCPVHAVLAMLHRSENHPALEADMKHTALAFGAVLALLGGCAAPYGASGNYYGGGGYYEPDYYAGQTYVPYGGYSGGYGRDHRDGDHAYRGQDRNQDRNRDHDRGDRQDNRQGNRQDNNRGNRQGNNPPAPQSNAQNNVQPGGGYHGGNTMPNGDRITRGNFWQLNQAQQNTTPQPSGTQPSGGSGGGRMGRHRAD